MAYNFLLVKRLKPAPAPNCNQSNINGNSISCYMRRQPPRLVMPFCDIEAIHKTGHSAIQIKPLFKSPDKIALFSFSDSTYFIIYREACQYCSFFTYKLFKTGGILLKKAPLSDVFSFIPMGKYPSGSYLLILFKDGKENGCYKIVKA